MAAKKFNKAQATKCLQEVRMFAEADEDLAKAALDIVNNYYWNSVRGTTADYLRRAKEGEFKDDEQLEEDLRQFVDDNYWVIYTYWARVCILCSNNADAYEKEMGSPPENESQRAYGALMQDIRNHPDFEEAAELVRSGGEDEDD